jgi:contractile injection system tube protein
MDAPSIVHAKLVPAIVHAKLIPAKRVSGQVLLEQAKQIEVQFNPATLRLTLQNTLKADNRSRAAAQYVDKSESSLAVELVFDTTVASAVAAARSDVRKLTRRIAEAFMKPKDADTQRPKAPQLCQFQWGAFLFTGMLASYGETLDFFAPEGIPLRATLALTFKEDRYPFELVESVQAPVFAPGGDGVSADRAAQGAGVDPRAWRLVADLNGLENPRFTPQLGVRVPRFRIG